MIGDRIKELREARFLTQAQMAEKTGININTLASYERNIREPRIEVITQLCSFFEVSSDYLLGLTPYPNANQCAAIDKIFSALPTDMRSKFLETQIFFLRAADTFKWVSGQVPVIGEIFYYLSDDLQKCINAYIRLVEGNTLETNWQTSPYFFVDQFLIDRAQMSQNVSGVINCIYQHGSIGADEILKNRGKISAEEDSHGLNQETDH